jgi:chemotaxis protein CheC
MRMSLPSVVRGDGQALFGSGISGEQFVLFLYIDFNIKKHNVRGFIALIMDLPSIAALKEIVNDYVNNIQRQSPSHVG